MSGKQRRKWPALVSVGALLTVSLTQSVWAGENESKDPVDGMNRETGQALFVLRQGKTTRREAF